MTGGVIVFGAAYSVYVNIVRLALAEKGVPFRLEEIDIFAPEGPPRSYLERQPFGRIPAFEHDGFRLHETAAITRYIDEAFDGPALMPAGVKARARAAQKISLLDNYAYRAMVWDVYVERQVVPERGGRSDEEKITAGCKTAEICLRSLETQTGDGAFLVGPDLSLADLHAAPMFWLFRKAPEGAALIARYPAIARWWENLRQRPSIETVLGG